MLRFGLAPWHLLLGPVVLLLASLHEGSSGATPHTILRPLGVLLGLVLLAWVGVYLLLRNARTAGLLVTLLTLAGAGYFAVAALASGAGHRMLVPLVYLTVLFAAGLVWWRGARLEKALTAIANAVLATAAVVLGLFIAQSESRQRQASAMEGPRPLALGGQSSLRPDVYVLVLEGHGREDTLRRYYGLEEGLAGRLRDLEFFVADRANANYPQMGQALASALNVDYLQTLLRADVAGVSLRRRLGDLMTNNRVFAAFHAAGYRIRAYEAEYALLRPEPADARPGPLVSFTNFEQRLYEGSLIPRLLHASGLPRGLIPLHARRHQILWTLDHLARERIASDAPPTFVFAHVLLPHPPFVFDADGRPRATEAAMAFNDGDAWHDLNRGTGERYEAGYVDAVKFVSQRVGDTLRVLTATTRPTVFYVLSNHGPGSRLIWQRPDPVGIQERTAILLAVRFPDGRHAPIHARTTPVNAFRVLLNRALGTQLDLLEDRTYFTTWENVGDFVDVTHQVR